MVNDKFERDYESKLDFIQSTTEYFNSEYPQYYCLWYGSDNDGNKIDFHSSSTTSHLDFYFDLVDKDNVVRANYAVELKERDEPYTSTYYGCDGQEGWLYNIEKNEWLQKAAANGYTPLYANVYPDNVVRVWNINKINTDTLPVVEKRIAKYTVIPSEKKLQKRYTLSNAQAVAEYKRVKGDCLR